MLDSLILTGAGLSLMGLVALANPILLGWKGRRDAVVALVIAAAMISAGWAVRQL
jgi:hypothetical protein